MDQLDHDPKAQSGSGGAGQYNSGTETESDQEDEFEDEEKIKATQQKVAKKGQRGGVSAEVYGSWNQKGDFKPKVVAKSAETRERLNKRLLQVFMFNSLDEKEY